MYSPLAVLAFVALALGAPIDSVEAVESLETRQTTTTCATGVHVIAARGSTQPAGEGSLADLSNLIKQRIPGSTSTAVIYPATLIPYASSEEKGVANMQLLIQQYLTSCPNAKLVLTGYSQGAQIVGDTLGGGSFSNSAPLAEKYRKNILAGVLFGDPARIPNKSYNRGNSTGDGLFPRRNSAQLDTYSAHLRSFCIKGDPVCDDGLDLAKHTAEVTTFQNEALTFVVGLAALR